MTEAEKAAKKGYEINKQDCWVHHNVSYNYLVCFISLSASCHKKFLMLKFLTHCRNSCVLNLLCSCAMFFSMIAVLKKQ